MAIPNAPSTPKGVRQAEAIVEAAIVCLGRDGYASASIQRIADEAGLSKRSVIYYYGNRERLFEQVIERITSRLLAQVAGAIEGLEEPADIATVGFNRVWEEITSDRALLAAYYGLVAESVTNAEFRVATRTLTDGFRSLLANVVADVEASGRSVPPDRDVVIEMIVAGQQGLQLAWLERGDTPALAGAISGFQHWMGSLAGPR